MDRGWKFSLSYLMTYINKQIYMAGWFNFFLIIKLLFKTRILQLFDS